MPSAPGMTSAPPGEATRTSASPEGGALEGVGEGRGQGDGDGGVVGLTHEGARGQLAEFGDVGGVPGLGGRALGAGAGGGALEAVEELGADAVDQVLALGAVDEEELAEDVVLQRLADEDQGFRGEAMATGASPSAAVPNSDR